MIEDNIECWPFVPEVEADLLPLFIAERKTWISMKDHIDVGFWQTDARSKIFKIFKLFFDKYHDFPTRAQCMNIVVQKDYGDTAIKEVEYIYDRFEKVLSVKERDYLTDECYKFIKENKIKVGFLKGVDLLEKGDYLGIEVVMKDAINWDPKVNLGSQITDVTERYDAIEKLYENVVRSPWHSVNIALGGGFFSEELTIFAGSSSAGKSIALDNCAFYGWDRGLNVVMITAEMSEIRKAQRMDAAALGIPIQEIRNKKTEVAEFYEHKQKQNRLFIKGYPTSKASMVDVMNYLYQLELYEGLKMHGGGTEAINLLVFDYLEIFIAGRKNFKGDAYTEQGIIGEEMRSIAQELKIPVISATQFSRGNLLVNIDSLTEGNLADSWKKMNTADCLIGIHNTPEERAANRLNYKILKCRNGAKDAIIPMNVQYDKLLISDVIRTGR